VTFDGKAQSETLKSAWSQYIEELPALRKYENFITFLAKHVRDPAIRDRLQRRVRIIFSGRLSKDDAALLLLRFYTQVVEAVARSYDALSPTVFTALQGASNSQHVSYKVSEVLAKTYPKPS